MQGGLYTCRAFHPTDTLFRIRVLPRTSASRAVPVMRSGASVWHWLVLAGTAGTAQADALSAAAADAYYADLWGEGYARKRQRIRSTSAVVRRTLAVGVA
jgi:hypothetical protein